MGVRAEFGLLGPLYVRSQGVTLPVTAATQRVVLAALAVRAGRVVSFEELSAALWGDAPPSGARVAVRNQVSRLRHQLGGAGEHVVTCDPGYVLDVTADDVDVLVFARLCREGGAAVRDGAWQRASDLLGDALGLWRGAPLGDVPSRGLQDEHVPVADAQRLQAIEWRLEAELHMGRHDELVPDLERLIKEHPLRERFRAQLMLALYRCGRQSDALAVYRDARDALAAELGIDPGEHLRQLHQQILAADPRLLPEVSSAVPGQQRVAPAGATGEHRPNPVVPRHLPADPRHFTGRHDELHALSRLLAGARQPGGTVVISAISGTAGVGKTALAVHWAHQAAPSFPDGQLYVNLRGYDPGQPMPVAVALAGFLRTLGVRGQDIPADEDERAAAYRSLLAQRRVLVVLDNAGSAEQVRPLLPAAPGCAVLVTSRDSLAGLVARDGAQRLDLDLLPASDAAGLLRVLIGERADADPAATRSLADLCCRLPLALRVAAELAVSQPAVPLATMVDELANQHRRLDLLAAGGDPRTGVRAVFSWSVRHLDARTARTFRLLGLSPGPDLDVYAVAALTGTTVGQAGLSVDLLARAYLIQAAGPGRYGLHDLLRAYACELAATHDGPDERRAALTRLFDYYLHTAAEAMDVLHPAERHRRPRIDPPATPAPPLADPAAAMLWLDAQRACLVAAATHTAGHDWPSHTIRLAATLARYLITGGHFPEAITTHTHALQAARLTEDQLAEAATLTTLGVIDWETGRSRQAAGHHRRALALYRATGNQAGQARALNNLGLADLTAGRYQPAAGQLQEALALYRAAGDQPGQARALTNLGLIGLRQGRYQEATGQLHEALALFRETGARTGPVHVLSYLGLVALCQGDDQQATGYLQEALADAREAADRPGEADALNGLGEVSLATGQPGQAHAHYAAALALASKIGDRYEQARAHDGLAHAYQASHDPDQARHHWQQALSLYTRLDACEADQVRAQILTAGHHSMK
jgi:DNA-binding SARP family transcriptional activator/Tfp pilus assembly protein PilF